MEEHSRNVEISYDYLSQNEHRQLWFVRTNVKAAVVFQTVTSQYSAISHEQPGDNKHCDLFMHTTGSNHHQVELNSAVLNSGKLFDSGLPF